MTRLSRREILAGGAAAALAACVSAPRSRMDRRPNILLILADDLGQECLGCYGGSSYETPHLDRMAREGLLFTHAFSTPLCSPTRVQLLTGRYPFRTGWTKLINDRPEGERVLDPGEITFAQRLRDAGYATAMAGKWQLCYFDEHPRHLEQCGFERSLAWAYKVADKTAPRYWAPLLWSEGRLVATTTEQYSEDIFCEFLRDFAGVGRERPFLAFWPMVLAHDPILPTPLTHEAGLTPLPTPLEGNEAQRGFAEMVAYMDVLVGRMLDALDAQGLAEDTLVLFTADNGSAERVTSVQRGQVVHGGKAQLDDAGTHVPLLARWPGTTPAGAVCDDLVDFSDFVPTFLELAQAPATGPHLLDGRSFAPRLRGQPGAGREWIYNQLGERRWVRDARWKLYADGRLLDLADDPLEGLPLLPAVDDTEAAAARERLGAVLRLLRA